MRIDSAVEHPLSPTTDVNNLTSDTSLQEIIKQLEENQVELQNDEDTLSSSEPVVVNLDSGSVATVTSPISAANSEQQKSSPSQLENIEHLIRQLRESQAELEKSNNEKEGLKFKLKESNMRIHNHKGAIKNSTQKIKMNKKEITKLQRQNTSHLEEKIRLRHEISWLTDRLNQRNKSDDETTVNDNAGDTDNSSTFTTVLYKIHSVTTKGQKPRYKPTKTKQSCRSGPTMASTPVLTDNAVTTRPKTEVANLGKSVTPRPTLGAGIRRRFKNRTRKTCSYVKRGATINIISNDLGITDGYNDSDKVVLICGTKLMIWLIVHLRRLGVVSEQ